MHKMILKIMVLVFAGFIGANPQTIANKFGSVFGGCVARQSDKVTCFNQ